MSRPTPATAWHEMVRGNERFVAGAPLHPRQDVERRASLTRAQEPMAALFGCSDSRLAAEIIFDKGIGDLFVVRNAGQIISDSVIGSLEYAVGVLNVPLIVVLGHDQCGAVIAAIDSQSPDADPLPPNIGRMISKIVPAVRRVSARENPAAQNPAADDPAAHDPARVDSVSDAGSVDPQEVGREHLRDTIAELLEASELISDSVAAGDLAIVGANYRLLEGRAVPDIHVGDLRMPAQEGLPS